MMQSFGKFVCATCAMVFKVESCVGTCAFDVFFAAGLFFVLLYKGFVCRILFVLRQLCFQSLHFFLNQESCVAITFSRTYVVIYSAFGLS